MLAQRLLLFLSYLHAPSHLPQAQGTLLITSDKLQPDTTPGNHQSRLDQDRLQTLLSSSPGSQLFRSPGSSLPQLQSACFFLWLELDSPNPKLGQLYSSARTRSPARSGTYRHCLQPLSTRLAAPPSQPSASFSQMSSTMDPNQARRRRRVGSTDSQKRECPHCGREFKRSEHLERHVRTRKCCSYESVRLAFPFNWVRHTSFLAMTGDCHTHGHFQVVVLLLLPVFCDGYSLSPSPTRPFSRDNAHFPRHN